MPAQIERRRIRLREVKPDGSFGSVQEDVCNPPFPYRVGQEIKPEKFGPCRIKAIQKGVTADEDLLDVTAIPRTRTVA